MVVARPSWKTRKKQQQKKDWLSNQTSEWQIWFRLV